MINRWLMIFCMLATCNSMANPLDEFRWQQRLLLINQADKTQLTEIWQFYKRHIDEFSERRMMLISVEANDIHCKPLKCPNMKASELKLSEAPHSTMILIGLDGGRKAAYPAQVMSFEEVFRDIDGMPMRRAELY